MSEEVKNINVIVKAVIAIINALARLRVNCRGKCCESECRMNQNNNNIIVEEEDEDEKYRTITDL